MFKSGNKISLVPQIIQKAMQIKDLLHVLKAFLVGYEAFINELSKNDKTLTDEN